MAGLGLERIPSSQDLDYFNVNRLGMEEVVKQSLYDFQTYPTAGATQFSFFQVPIGQSSKTKADTNMTLAGALPNPQKFLAQSVEVYFFPGGEINRNFAAAGDQEGWSDDIEAIYHGIMHLEMTIGSKPYLTEAPLVRMPPKTYIKGNFAIAGTYAATAGNVLDMSAATGRPYFLTPPLMIPSMQNFTVQINAPTAIATPSGLDGRIGVVLDGLLYRLSQ